MSNVRFIRKNGRIIPLRGSDKKKTSAANKIDAISGAAKGFVGVGFHKTMAKSKKFAAFNVGTGAITSALRFSRDKTSLSDDIGSDVAGSLVKFSTGLAGGMAALSLIGGLKGIRAAYKSSFAKGFKKGFKRARKRVNTKRLKEPDYIKPEYRSL